jgi:hypothetical protein
MPPAYSNRLGRLERLEVREYARGVLADLRMRLQLWMEETDDPLLAGHVDPPAGVEINLPDQRSAREPMTPIE